MIYLKILFQILMGLSGAIAFFLDYKWRDRRTKKFKRARNSLFAIFFISLSLGIYLTVKDEKTKKEEISRLENSLLDANRVLSEIKQNDDTLKAQLKPFLELATKKFPDYKENIALKKLYSRLDQIDSDINQSKEKIGHLTSELNIEKNTFGTFDAKIYVEFTGKWNGAPYPLWLQHVEPTTYLSIDDSSNKKPKIEFKSTKVNFKTIDESTAAFENNLTVLPGDSPQGKLIQELSGYDRLHFWFPFMEANRLLEPKITVSKVEVSFFINGKKNGQLFHYQKTDIQVDNQISETNPGLLLSGNIYKMLNFSTQ